MADIKFIRRNLKGLSISGLWDYYQSKNSIKSLVFSVYGKLIFFSFMCFNISQFIEMYNVKGDIPALMQNAGVTLLYSVMVVMSYTITFRKNKYEKLLDKIRAEEQRIFSILSEDEIQVYMENVDYCWFVTSSFWFLCFSTILMFFVARPAEYYFMGPQESYQFKVPLVFSSWFPFDPYSDQFWKVAFSFQICSGCIGAYYAAVGDSFLLAFMIFAVGQFRLIQFAIRNLHNLTNEEKLFYHGAEILDLYPKTVEVIKHHCRTIDYVRQLDVLVNPIILLNFLVCSMMICSVGLEGIIAGPSIRLALSLYYIAALLIRLFLCYWHANEVTLESLNIRQAVCESEWFRFSPRVKKALLMVLIRTNKPSVLSVGGFYAMSLNTFLMILRGAYSFLALFRKVYSRENE